MNRSLTHPPSSRPRRGGGSLPAAAVLLAASCIPVPASQTWRGLVVQPENRCSAYSRKDYPYPQSVEARIVASMGGRVHGPYSGRTFAGTGETDIEHVVATSEAHDSGLCAADAATRRAFARDILNLTLASPAVNRGQKSDRDAAQWLTVIKDNSLSGHSMSAMNHVAGRRETSLKYGPKQTSHEQRPLV